MTDKTDRELLELAAKAAGITLTPVETKNVTKQGDDRFIGYRTDPDQWPRGWFDPLTDDGDALRLAVKLGLDIEMQEDCVYANGFGVQNYQLFEWHNNDPYAATRRAIVKAAAEIGNGIAQSVGDDLQEDDYYKSMAEAEEIGRAAEIGKGMK